jgi:hypothetical protein
MEKNTETDLLKNYSNNVNTIHEFFTSLNEEKFIDIIQKNKSFPSFLDWINYYLWLFRKEKVIKDFLNSPKFPNDFIIQYIYYSFGKWISMGNNPDYFFMEITGSFSKEKTVQILVEENLVEIDANLSLSFISNLDETSLKSFFDKTDNTLIITDFFLNLFGELDDEVIKSFFIKNPGLYIHILSLFKDVTDITEKKQKKISKFQEKFKEDFEMLDKILLIKEKVFKAFNMEAESKKNYNERNFKRISYIVKKLRGTTKIEESIQILYKHYVIIDRMEKDLIRQILTDDFISTLTII